MISSYTWEQGSWDNMGPIWERQDPGWLYVGTMNFAVWYTRVYETSAGCLRSIYHRPN